MARSAERGMAENTLQRCTSGRHMFVGTGTSQICKFKEEFKVTTAGAGEVLTWQVLKTGFHTIACLEPGFLFWYVGLIITCGYWQKDLINQLWTFYREN